MPVTATSDAMTAPTGPQPVPMRAWVLAWYGLAVLIAATILAAVDRQILVLLAEPMRKSLGLSDTKLGLLQGAGIALFSGLAAVPLGWLADRFGRKTVLASCVLVWTAATAACGAATDFSSLFAAAIGLGIGEAGLAPVVYGLIPDMVPPSRRSLANGIYALAAILGAGLGISLSGAMIGWIDTVRVVLPDALAGLDAWRLSFFAVALPGPVIAVLILLIRLRPVAAQAASAGPAGRDTLRGYLRSHVRTIVGVFGGSGLGSLGIHALAAWAPVVATRNFGASAQQVGQGIGAAYMVGTLAGALVGAFGVKRLRAAAGIAAPLRVLWIGTALAALASAGLAFAGSALQVYVLFGLQVAFLICGTVVAPTLLQDMSPPALRSRVIAFGSVIVTLLAALSPVLVGVVSDVLVGHPDGLLLAVATVAAVSMAIGAFICWRAEARFVHTVSLVAGQAPPPPPHTS